MSTARLFLPSVLLAVTAIGPFAISLGAGNVTAESSDREGSGSVQTIDVADAAREIDRLVESGLEAAGMRPNGAIDDATFLRRAYVQLAGRIPTLAEQRRFDAESKQGRRDRLIDELLASDAYSSRMFLYFADLLRVREKIAGNNYISGEPYIHFIKESIASHQPFDEFVTDLLTADGPSHERGNGATGYFLRDRGMPEDNMANTARLFLGTRIECAQCHNHPFDKWTQKEFFQMTAFTGGIEFRDDEIRGTPVASRIQELRSHLDSAGVRGLKRVLRSVTAGVLGSGTGVAQLPKEYAYDDAKPGEWVTAKTLFGESAQVVPSLPEPVKKKGRGKRGRNKKRLAAEIDSRVAYAEWMTSPSNPLFTKVIANRMWRFAMGRGLVEPVDSWNDDTTPSNPQLLDFLERLMIDVEYDLREFLRVVFRTETWQRGVSRNAPDPDTPYLFPGPVLQRMSAEQLWDSMLTLVLDDVDATLAAPDARAEEIYQRYDDFVNQSEEELQETVDDAALRYRDPKAYKRMLALKKAEERGVKAEAKKLMRRIAKARRKGNSEVEAKLLAELRQLGVDPDAPRTSRRKTATAMVRASELPQPAPDDHFLRQFGQSDREQIDASFDEATVPQVLSLLNGFLEDHVLHDAKASVAQAIESESTTKKRVEVAFRATLGRDPTAEERRVWTRDVDKFQGEGMRDLVWTLVNSHEFRFIR